MLAERDATINRLLAERESAESKDPEPENTESKSTAPENPEPQYEAVDITIDNWQNYFELYAKNNFAKNAFGEFDMWHCDCYFVLKDGIEVGTDNNKVAFECKYTVDRVQYAIDLETQTVTYGEILEPAFWTRQDVLGMGWESIYDVSTFESVRVFGCNLHQSTTSSNLEGEILKVNHFEILRIEGTLYIAK